MDPATKWTTSFICVFPEGVYTRLQAERCSQTNCLSAPLSQFWTVVWWHVVRWPMSRHNMHFVNRKKIIMNSFCCCCLVWIVIFAVFLFFFFFRRVSEALRVWYAHLYVVFFLEYNLVNSLFIGCIWKQGTDEDFCTLNSSWNEKTQVKYSLHHSQSTWGIE